MKIAISGYGKMGREIELVARSRGHVIASTFDIDNLLSPDELKASGAEVVIDFTQPDVVRSNVEMCAKAKIPIVIGTTGWENDSQKVKKLVEDAGIGCVSASNFSIGVNLFFRIVSEASRLLSTADYDVFINETHHRMKKDFPSGTALKIAEEILTQFPSKKKAVSELTQGKAPHAEELVISSVRAGLVTGTHTVGFEAEEDSIELTHRAKSRRGFALGAVRAAEWIAGKKGMYRFEEHLEEILQMK
jgi:4-hydroxy-tetrahydrodipicolinate reductase